MKAVQAPTTLLSGQSLASSFTSPAISVLEVDVCGIQLNYTGSPVGTITILGSIDGVNYATLSFSVAGSTVSSFALPASTSPIVLDLTTGSLVSLQVAYAATSGSGSMTITTSKKRLGD